MTDHPRLYLITPPVISDLGEFCEALKSALGGGDVACLQVRLKSHDGVSPPDDVICKTVDALLPITKAAQVSMLINDRPDLAHQCGADGVHIGQDDSPYEAARNLLGSDAIIGVTCHNSRHLGLVAGEAGADYVAFGAFFPTQTKDAPTRADPDLLTWWQAATTVQSVAIGGITPDNCGALVRAGADFLAVSAAVWNHAAGPGEAVKAFEQAIAKA